MWRWWAATSVIGPPGRSTRTAICSKGLSARPTSVIGVRDQTWVPEASQTPAWA